MTGLREDITSLLEGVQRGEVAPTAALDQLAHMPYRKLGFARIDTHRELRQGAPEAVLGEGKTVEEIVAIVSASLDAGAGSVLVTRAAPPVRAAIRTLAPDAHEDVRARAVWVERGVPSPRGRVAMISAGTSDGPVIHEARIRAELIGTSVTVGEDMGAAGLHRLTEALPDIAAADCVVVAAGMDGALATVVGGIAACPVIGVPTSVGYGSAAGGYTALNSMLASCAAGLAVVGIDDGFGAGTIAAMIARANGAEHEG